MFLRGNNFAARLSSAILAGKFNQQQASKQFLAASNFNKYFFSTQEGKKFNYFDFGSKMIPHPDKAHKGGEDALYTNSNLLSVADGVGGWADVGVDPGLYSKKLCKNIGELAQNHWDLYKISVRQLLIDAAERTKEVGSSTVCITILDEQRPLLHTAFIGDSSYMILRKTDQGLQVVFRSEEQQREFNFPYQIGSEGDPPQIAEINKHPIQHNDIVILGTDGLFDNVEDKQIVNLVNPFTQASSELFDIPLVAEMIADLAFKCSMDVKFMSPFARKAQEAYFDYIGGKSDDITVVVGQIKLVGTQRSVNQSEF